MKKCPKCDRQREETNFCYKCGTVLEENKRCAKCGAYLEAADGFCANCGAPENWKPANNKGG